jgi:hypothetical protein
MASHKKEYDLVLTTQGPTYPPSEIMDKDGNFVVIGRINTTVNTAKNVGRTYGAHGASSKWGGAIVSQKSKVPTFGENYPYDIVREFDVNNLSVEDSNMVLHTLPVPLPCNNYPMIFAPEQKQFEDMRERPSYPLHRPVIKDFRVEDGWKINDPITLGTWVKAQGILSVELSDDATEAIFNIKCTGLIPNGLYTIMSLRENDFNVTEPTRPGPLGIPNVMVTDPFGNGQYHAVMPNPFPDPNSVGSNRIINVILLWMAYQRNYGGAMALFGLGGDVHAQLKLDKPSFYEFTTFAKK